MATYNAIPVCDTEEHNVIQIGVQDGDDILDVVTDAHDSSVAARITVDEALELIAALSSAIQVALHNRSDNESE